MSTKKTDNDLTKPDATETHAKSIIHFIIISLSEPYYFKYHSLTLIDRPKGVGRMCREGAAQYIIQSFYVIRYQAVVPLTETISEKNSLYVWYLVMFKHSFFIRGNSRIYARLYKWSTPQYLIYQLKVKMYIFLWEI